MKVVTDKNGIHMLTSFDYIGKGQEAKVYRKNDVAYKCYHLFRWCQCLTKEDVSFLEQIKTDCILLPQTTLYNVFGDFCGYTTRYIENLGLLHFVNLPSDNVISNFHLLQNDAVVLGKNKVLVSDFMPKDLRVRNHSFHDGLYFVDPGRYFRRNDMDEESVIQSNIDLIDHFVFFRVFNSYCHQEFGEFGYNFSKLYSLYTVARDRHVSFLESIEDDLSDDNLQKYIKRKIL